jgi:Spy/CpxP family protein refolding chaperone
MDRDKIRDKIEFIRMWKMLEVLDLDKATAEKILAIRGKYVARKKNLRRALNEDFDKLRHELRTSPQGTNDAELKRLLDSIRDKRERLRALWGQQYEEVAKHLTIRQQAKLMLFLKDFRKEIRSMLRLYDRHPPMRPTDGKDRPRQPAAKPAVP